MKQNEHYEYGDGEIAMKAINDNPDYRVFWRMGYAFRGAREVEENKTETMPFGRRYRMLNFKERMEARFDDCAIVDTDVLHDKREIHINGFSYLDME